MIPEQWQKAKELFDAALKRPPDERLQFLDENCNGDEDVRREVESLLANAEDAVSFLENPAVGEVAKAIVGNREKLRVSQILSHYKIIKLLGAGGMGEVSPDLERIINKSLRKDRAERYQTMKDLLIDLKDSKQELEFQNKFGVPP